MSDTDKNKTCLKSVLCPLVQCNRVAESEVDEILRQHSENAAFTIDKERDCFVSFDPLKSRLDILLHAGAAEGKEKWGVKHTLMASAGAQAYNGGLGAEPPVGVQGPSPRWGSGGNAPAAEEVFVFKTVIFNASATVLHEMMYCLS